ncbi:MAG: tail fiber domain-containing protein [Bacteroidales bacterium]|nr:tail fiber domain-containing protein [Bacteroidales bacterium]
MSTNIITKGILATAVLSALATGANAQQLPNSFNYQAVVNAEDGSPVAAKKITVEVSVLQGTDCDKNSTCPVLWQELHYPTTNDFGLFSIEIGASDATNTLAGSCAQYSDIDWLDVSQGYYYLKVRADFGESEHLNSLSDLGVSKFSAVPYALVAQKTDFAANAGSATTAASAGVVTADANDKIPNKLSQLADVDVSAVQTGQVLSWDGSQWISKSVSSAQGASALGDLTDVNVTGATDGDYLAYNNSGKWTKKAFPTLVTQLGQLSDVTTTGASAGQVLSYSSSGWIPKTMALGDLKDVSPSSSITNGEILVWDATSSAWKNKKLSCPWEKGTTTSGDNYIQYKNSYVYDNGIKIQNSSKNFLIIGDGTANGNAALAMAGGAANEFGTIAIGSGSKTNYQSSVAIGLGVETSCPNSLVLGVHNASVSQGFFIIGNGTKSDDRKNAFYVTSTGNVYAEGTITSQNIAGSSDRRLKTNIKPLEKSIDKVMKLNGVTFNWDKSVSRNANAPTTLQYGFIAQELEKVLPELVNDGDDGYKTVNYIGVIPVLTQAMQEQQAEIEQLKEENKKLSDTIDALLKRVEALEKK